jgi:Tol biopolymer transport system component
MFIAEETYRVLAAKARRLIPDAFSGRWSPDGRKVVFSLGGQGYSGVAVSDQASRKTGLLIVPGRDPSWSPDGRKIAFVRDCEALRLSDLAGADRRNQRRAAETEEVWVMDADGAKPRRLASGAGWPSWSPDARHVYYHSRADNRLIAQHSDDGLVWRDVLDASDQTVMTEIPMDETVHIGLAVTSHDVTRAAEARISYVATTGNVSPSGPFTNSQDIPSVLSSPLHQAGLAK